MTSNRAEPWRWELMQRLAFNGLLSLLFHRTQDHQLRVAPPTMGCTLPQQSLIKKKKCSTGLPTARSYGDILLAMGSLLSDDLACVKLL